MQHRSDLNRPDPKELLEYLQEEERAHSKGKLKIFLGAAPGVGKTYAMLQDALERRKEGVDVVAGVVETHGRVETEAFLKQLEVLPGRTFKYREKNLQEFDLEAALLRKPDLLLVDEMAHSNVPGSRHNKRWQDIMELLDRGIDVYTTVNVQHIESLNNIITQITGIIVRETVPDSVLEKAHAIELIDLPSEDLIKRLEEGKVYVPVDIGLAIEHFFRKSNLAALRELALRVTAEQVNAEVLLHRRGESIQKIWPTKERLLVCVGPDTYTPKVIRSAFRMAKALQAEWIAVAVETPMLRLNEESHHQVIQHLRLAELLGAETLSIGGTHIADSIIEFARSRNVSKIILGKRIRSRWKEWLTRSLADELVHGSDDIDLYILRDNEEKQKSAKIVTHKTMAPKTAYFISLLTVIACTIINLGIYKYLGLATVVMLNFLGIIFVALQGFFGPSLLASVLSVFTVYYFFMPHQLSFSVTNIENTIILAMLLLVSQVVANLTIQGERQVKSARKRELRIASMHRLSKALATHRGVKVLLGIATRHVSDIFNSKVIALLPDESHHLRPVLGHTLEKPLSAKEESVAQWVYELGQVAGLGTQTLPDNAALYVPLLGKKGPVGVLRVLPKDPERFLVPEQLHLLEGFSNQIAMALEVDRLQNEAQKTELQIESDRVRSILLKYISHNMHVPLIDIMSSVNHLIEVGQKLNLNLVLELGDTIYNNAAELNHLINNIAQIVRLETSEITPHKKLHSLVDVVHSALKSLTRRLGNRPIRVMFPDNLPKILFNKVFLEQVFFNIIENALKYTPEGSPIDIVAVLEVQRVLVSVEDQGPGLALEEINKIFEKFYRGQAITHIKGMGLGLAICQRIITLHGGEIWAENRVQGGAVFKFTLPF